MSAEGERPESGMDASWAALDSAKLWIRNCR